MQRRSGRFASARYKNARRRSRRATKTSATFRWRARPSGWHPIAIVRCSAPSSASNSSAARGFSASSHASSRTRRNTTNVAAIALYLSVGFESFGLERAFLLVDGVLYDELHMAYDVERDRE